MKKTDLEQFNNVSENILFWCKNFVSEKVNRQKVDDGYSDSKIIAKRDEIIFFSREEWQSKILNINNIEELKDITLNLRRNGLKKLSTFSVPVIHFLNYISSLKKIKEIKDIDTNTVHTYISLHLTDKSDWTKTNYLTHLKGLFKFIDKYSKSEDDFQFEIGISSTGKKTASPVSTPKKSDKYFEPNEFVDFVKKIDKYKSNHPNPFQPKLLMKFFCFTGVRSNELRNIKVSDVSVITIDNKKYLKIYINGKDDIDRFVHISYDLIKNDYEKEIESRNTDCEYLFYSRKLEQYAIKSVYDLVQRFLDYAGVEKRMDSHGIRRSMATYLHAKGVEYLLIAKILGHTDESSTSFYVFPSKDSFKNIKDLLG